ncbi:hypothetical protein ACFV1B_13810 [Streptomyces sp. NPDC059637]|uniref:hypothetical protein n=1 Tax=Streptomyces sp. NPDC059637 TaxID=3347752 RepID=UPI003683364A
MCLTTWLNNGVPPAQVAEWAGNSVAVLLATYARCISGRTEDLQRRIEAAQDISGLTPKPEPSRRTSTRIRRGHP